MTDPTHSDQSIRYLTPDERAVLRAALESATPHAVARRVGVGAASLLRMVNGHSCQPDTIRRVRTGLAQVQAQPPADATPDAR